MAEQRKLSTKRVCFVDEVGWDWELSTKRVCFVDEVGWDWELSTKRGCFVDETGFGTGAWWRMVHRLEDCGAGNVVWSMV